MTNVPDALKILYILYRVKSPVDVKDIHRIVDIASSRGICCKQYSFARYPWGPYSKDLEADLEILRSLGLVSITNGNTSRRLVITEKGVTVAINVERVISPNEKERLESLFTGHGDQDRANG
ncbi:hypothetical protein ATG_01110 [Desulfurococcaceae archaeon AG1]|nr:hypothetical protein ATG_01110 [Desulfurococcaceae archaeon AG1]